MKTKKVKYNPKGLKRTDNIVPKTSMPKKDLNFQNVNVIIEDHYWKISKKK